MLLSSISNRIIFQGFFSLYKRGGRTVRFLKCFDALAFLPDDLVVPGFEALIQNNPRPRDERVKRFYRYKERTYIGDRCVVRREIYRIRLTNRRAPRFVNRGYPDCRFIQVADGTSKTRSATLILSKSLLLCLLTD